MKKRLFSLLIGAAVSLFFAEIFYMDPRYVVFTWPAGVIAYVNMKRRRIEEEKNILIREIADSLAIAEINLRAGYSIENALVGAEKEIYKQWGDESRILPFWQIMNRRINLRESVTDAFFAMSEAIGMKELKEFSEILALSKRSGGSIADLIGIFVNQLSEKLQVESEIYSSLAEKRMEKNIMMFMPPGIILYLLLSSYEWIAVLYETGSGRIFMSGCLIIYSIAAALGEVFLNIRV